MNLLGYFVILLSGLFGITLWILTWYLVVYFDLGSVELLEEFHKNRSAFPEQRKISFFTLVLLPVYAGTFIHLFQKLLNYYGYYPKFKEEDLDKVPDQ